MSLPEQETTNCAHFPGGVYDALQITSSVWSHSGPVTIEYDIWVESVDKRKASVIAFGSNADADRILVLPTWDNGTHYFDYGGFTNGRVSTPFQGYGKWTKVKLTSGGNTNTHKRIYFDGALIAEVTGSVGPTTSKTGFKIGFDAETFKGYLRDIKIWQDNTLFIDLPLRSDFVDRVSGQTAVKINPSGTVNLVNKL